MDTQKEYKDVLLEVAREVYGLVFGDNSDEALLQRLRNTLKSFAAQADKHRQYMKEQCQQARKAKKAFVVTNNMQIPNKYKDPVLMFRLDRTITANHRIVLSPTELNKKEAEQRDIVGLACIYDNCRVQIGKREKINNSIVPEDTYEGVWRYISGEPWFYEGKAEFWKTALTSIQQSGKAGNTNVEKVGEVLEPKPPEFLQKLLWVLKYGKKHWKLILLAVLILLIGSIFVLPKFDLF